MKIVGVSACVAGIAHTYVVKERLISTAQKRGHQIHIETQGVVGQENKIPDNAIEEADVVILATDVSISGRDRFIGKRIIEVPTKTVVQNCEALIKKIEDLLMEEKQNE